MTNLQAATVEGAAATEETAKLPLRAMAFYVLAAMILVLATTLPFATDYVGPDNDDAMRLVQVRDLLAGQGWFDMTQYRLGLAGGTLMHWSRLIDLPIANLIEGFGLFLSPERAEAAALTVWPLLMIAPVLFGIGLAGFRLGGQETMHAALVLASMFVLSAGRFQPGAIDHHNVQLALLAMIAAMLVDPRHSARSYAIAGLLCALAIAIGAETTPLVAVVCLIVALRWAWHGEIYRRAAAAFGMSFAATATITFFATVPPALYRQVTCDNLSYGYYALATYGGAALFLVASTASGWNGRARLAALATAGSVLAGAAVLIAPNCLRSPLADLDPMLVTFWLSSVTEAQSIFGQWRYDPAPLAAFYLPGLIAIVVCLGRLLRRDRVEAHLSFLALLVAAFTISLVQVRGNVFTNLVAMPPLALAIADLRRRANADTKNLRLGLGFAALTLASVSSVWAIAGFLLTMATGQGAAATTASASAQPDLACESHASMRVLAAEPTSVVAAASDLGAEILRFTRHRALSAPYHRNQGGMLTELHIGLSAPKQAEAFLRGAGVTLLAFCPSNGQVRSLARAEPEGLYARLSAGDVPPYLQQVQNGESQLQIYRVIPEAADTN
ncbi:hypothetical protein J2Y48_000635 [Mycoplana sp. BE70]|uniref:hypothetical protein n=1 Tax=Mycoplana sp. BE70 TaxID=2817775 RepID=UPI002856C98F|nr:hypothetical protein [Mycoplana sp. BE70]MDR6755362.1 hypothetical protein [Mycoplana sp. BE70]